MQTKTLRILALGLFGTAAGLWGQQDSLRVRELDEVVVTDTRFPIPREESGKTVIRLDREILDGYRGNSVAEILNLQSGIEISGSRGRPGEVLGVFARGGRGRQVLVLIDGMRVSDPSSFAQEYDLRLLQASQIESIEILKGASSTLYGTNAATAVIHIKTRRAADKPFRVSLDNQVGTQASSEDPQFTWGQYGTNLRVDGSSKHWSYVAGFGHQLSNGLSSLETPGNEKDTFRNLSYNAAVGYAPNEHTEFRLRADRSSIKSAYDNAADRTDANYAFFTDQDRLSLEASHEAGPNRIEWRSSYTAFYSENRSDFPGTFEGRSWTSEIIYKREWGPNFYSLAGLSFLSDRAELDRPRSFTLTDPYLNLVWFGPGRFNLNAGLRYNLHSEYGGQAVYQVNPSWRVPLGKGYLKVLGTWATSYITPSLNQLFGAFGANPDLEPERNRTIEAGMEWKQSDRLRLNLLYFNRREADAVLFNNADFLFFNADSLFRARGLEGEAQWRISKAWDLGATYAFTEREGDAAIRIPKHKITTRLGFRPTPRLKANLSWRYTGSRTDTDFTIQEQVELEPFSLWDTRVSYSWWDSRIRTFFTVSNLFNTDFTEIVGFQTPGRNVILGWSLHF